MARTFLLVQDTVYARAKVPDDIKIAAKLCGDVQFFATTRAPNGTGL